MLNLLAFAALAALASINAGFYASTRSPFHLGAAIFCAFIATSNLVLAVAR